MVFSSPIFLFLFLPLSLLIYYLINPKYRNYFLFFASLIFYVWGAPNFILFLLLSLSFDYIFALLIAQNKNNNKIKKTLLAIDISASLGLLIYFKYANFFIQELNNLLRTLGIIDQIHWIAVVLPIGISFVVFHKISYVVDIYRETLEPFRNIIDFFLYILFFPQLIAGPIVRFHEIAEQILSREHTRARFLEGIWRFSIGLGRKVIIANTLGSIADKIFQMPPDSLNIITSWIGILFYTFQIYYDFSGYSDMAIGLGKMFGFELPENFNRPYIAMSITEFWHRWHMSLSRFFKDYLYIPLGGNRCSKARNYVNLWLVFLLCGFWHGANWTFIIWGVYHGFLLIIEKVYLLKKLSTIPAYARNIFTFLLVMIGWVFFRSETITNALYYLRSMFSIGENAFVLLTEIDIKVITILIFVMIFTFIKSANLQFTRNIINDQNLRILKWCASLLVLIYSCSLLSTQTFNPFIYFRF